MLISVFMGFKFERQRDFFIRPVIVGYTQMSHTVSSRGERRRICEDYFEVYFIAKDIKGAPMSNLREGDFFDRIQKFKK